MIRFARPAVIGVAAAAVLVAPTALATVQYVDPVTHQPVVPGTYDFTVALPPCFLDDNLLHVTGLSIANAQLMIDSPKNFANDPVCNPLLGVFIESTWDKNNDGTIDSLEPNDPSPSPSPSPSVSEGNTLVTTNPTPAPTPSPTPTPTPKPSSSPSVLGSSTVASPTPTPVVTPAPTSPAKGSVLGASVLPGVGSFGNLISILAAGLVALISARLYRRFARKAE
jgi:hypothetical protein